MGSKKQRNFFIILILGALSTVTPFAIDMYLPAFPQIAADLETTAPKIAFSLSSYLVGMAIGQIFYGPLLDRFGRKPPLYFGLLLFIAASVGCISSGSVESLIAFRFLQALGGCAAQVAAVTMVRDFFPPEERTKVFSPSRFNFGSRAAARTDGRQFCRRESGLAMGFHRFGCNDYAATRRRVFLSAGRTRAGRNGFVKTQTDSG